MFRRYGVLMGLCFWSVVLWGNELREETLARQIQRTPHAGLRRFAYMRYYVPAQELSDVPGFWDRWFSSQAEKAQSRALAFYLFNMYVTTNSYSRPNPAGLTLNDLGVLDALMLCEKPFDFKHAFQFYQEHLKEIQDWLQVFFAGKHFPWPNPAESDYARWVKLLETQSLHQKQVVYQRPDSFWLTSAVPPEINTRLTPFLTQSRMQAARQVILYDEPDLRLEDFDSKIRSARVRRKRTYRWVNEECNYSSYITSKLLTEDIVQHRKQWGSVRIYQLTAYPARGEFLLPAHGRRFILRNGKPGLAWRYHTAVLVIVRYNGSYVPVILDSFLGGTRPLAFAEWLARFNSQTVFTAVPFQRNETIENAMQVPQKREGRTIWVNGRKYMPADVIK